MLISDILQTKGHEVTTAQTSDLVITIVQALAEKRIGAIVIEDPLQKLVGIFSERDLVNALAHYGAETLDREVRGLMSAPVVTCSPGERVDVALATMTRRRIRHLPVVENGHLIGIVSIGDLVHGRLGEKELEAGVLLDIARRRA